MKTLLIDVNYGNSSTGKIVQDLQRELEKKGHLVRVCFGRGAKVEKQNVVRVAPSVEVYFHALMTRLTGLTGYFSPFATAKLLEEIKNFSPDVVHIHELHAYFINIRPVIDLLKEMNIKVIWTFHCEFMYTGKCGHAYECEGWKKECGKCPYLQDYPASLYFDFTRFMFNQKKLWFQGFDKLKIVTPSRWLADRVGQSFLNSKAISVIHNGIDTDEIFYPREISELIQKHQLENKKIILSVAPDIMDERKGGEWVLQLAALFPEKYVFILVGVKDTNRNFPKNVIALQKKDNQHQLAEYYSLADLFVICSKRENLPTTCLESLACGTPVIGFDEGGTKETAPGKLGHFVPYGDLQGLKNAVYSYFNKDLDLSDSDGCVKYARAHYSKHVMFENYFKLYQASF